LRLGLIWLKGLKSRFLALLDLIRGSDRRPTVSRLDRRCPNGTNGFGQVQGCFDGPRPRRLSGFLSARIDMDPQSIDLDEG
jgi:hypothetical protein